MSQSGKSWLIVAILLPVVGEAWRSLLSMPPADVATAYSHLLADLDAETSGDAESLLELAPDIQNSFEQRFRDLAAAAEQARTVESSIVRLGAGDKARLVHKREVISLVRTLGEASLRVSSAKNWTDYWLRQENKKFFDARLEAQERSREELLRVYLQFREAVASRQLALQKLNGILSGRLKVVVEGTEGRRDATYAETMAYIAALRAEINGGIYVAPPRKILARDLFAQERLEKLKEQQPKLARLQELVDGELRRLASEHFLQVKAVLAGKADKEARASAILSLGWWNRGNNGEGVALALASIGDEEFEIRSAGIVALGRMRSEAGSLDRFKKHKLPAVRSAVIELIQNRVHDLDGSAQALRPLLIDEERSVRLEAYAALDRIADLKQDQRGEVFKLAIEALGPMQDWKIVVDAVAWVDRHGVGGDEKLAKAMQKARDRLHRYHRDKAAGAAPATVLLAASHSAF